MAEVETYGSNSTSYDRVELWDTLKRAPWILLFCLLISRLVLVLVIVFPMQEGLKNWGLETAIARYLFLNLSRQLCLDC